MRKNRILPLMGAVSLVVLSHLTISCTGSSVTGNENGSQPVNDAEVNEYKRAVHKCYKTGGTRVVKIQGQLRCFD